MAEHSSKAEFLTTLPVGPVARVAFWIFAGVGAYFLWTEHRVHLGQALPWILLMLCPLLHLFMHRGHGDRSSSSPGDEEPVG